MRMVFENMTSKEELLTVIPMKEQTRGEYIYNSLKTFIDKTEFPVHKLVSITTDSIRARNNLLRQEFCVLLEDTEAEYGDLSLHTDERWLSCGAFLKRFCVLLPEIKDFLKMKGGHIAELEDDKWAHCNITGKLNGWNINLQGIMSAIKTFKARIKRYAFQLRILELRNFEKKWRRSAPITQTKTSNISPNT